MSLAVTPLRARSQAEPEPVELTILMPCLNEADTVGTCVEKACRFLRENGVSGEVLVADNGSSDGSQDLARQAGARVEHIPDRGYGAALLGGIKAARGRLIIMGDADDSYDFVSLMPFLKRLRAGDKLVMGNRFRGGIKPGAMPFLHRYLGNPVLSFLGRLLFRVPIGDFHCGLRGFSREAIMTLSLVSPGMEFASEMVVKSRLKDFEISEVPTVLSPDGRSRPPHLKTWRDGWRHLRFLLLHSPRWLFLYPGLALLGLGLLGILTLLTGPLHLTPSVELNFNTLLISDFSVLVGVQFVSFAILARRFAATEGVLPPIYTAPTFIESLTLERWLQIGLMALIIGVGGVTWSVWHWAKQGFGPIYFTGVMRYLSFSLTLIALAFQLGASAFLASVFDLRRRDAP